MIIKLIPSGKTEDVNASYAARLIEQGKAVNVDKAIKAKKPVKVEAEAEPIQEPEKKNKKG